ncbi:MAG TPA: TIGR01777 family oxidoreductase [Thermoanaerobaculia bacterium]
MRVVITGGTGLIGGELARELGVAGHDVVVLTRNLGKTSPLPPGVQAVQWDGRTSEGWRKLLGGDTAIVHLAGESIATGRWSADKKRRIRDSRVESGRAVAQAIREVSDKPKVLLQGSAVGWYGDRGDELLGEDSSPGTGFLADVCKEWEASTAEVEALGVRRALLRTGVVLARQGGALPPITLPFRLMAGGPIGDGRQWFPWIHLADEVGAIRFLLEREDARGPFNLAAPNPVTNLELTRLLGRVLRRPSFLPAPGFALRLALGEKADMLLQGQRAVPARLLELGYVFRYPDPEAALRNLLD